MNCCLFKKCVSKPRTPASVEFPPHSSTVSTIACGRCGLSQAVPETSLVMICSKCRCVNRIRAHGIVRSVSFIDCDVGDSEIVKNTPALFQLGEASDGRSIPICSVCLDGVGDILLEHCGHGGICEECARHIALNKAVGGAHCPLDKREILFISRIGELHDEFAKVRAIELPEQHNHEPPKVPPPVGLRKNKSSAA